MTTNYPVLASRLGIALKPRVPSQVSLHSHCIEGMASGHAEYFFGGNL